MPRERSKASEHSGSNVKVNKVEGLPIACVPDIGFRVAGCTLMTWLCILMLGSAKRILHRHDATRNNFFGGERLGD